MNSPFRPASAFGPASATGVSRNAVLVFLLCLAIGVVVVIRREMAIADGARANARTQAVAYSAEVQRRLLRALEVAHELGRDVRQSGGRFNTFQTVAAELQPWHPGIARFELLPNGVVADVFPRRGNERWIGRNVFADPAARPSAGEASQQRRLVVDGPRQFAPGEPIAVVGRLPVFLPGRDGREQFWGFVAVTMQLPQIARLAHLDELGQHGYDFNFYAPATSTQPAVSVTANTRSALRRPVVETIQVANLRLALAVTPRDGVFRVGSFAFTSLLALALAALLAGLVDSLEKRRAAATAVAEASQRSARENERFRTLLEASPEPLILADRAGRIQLVNAQAEQLFGWTRKELIGQPVELLQPERFRKAHAAHRARYLGAPSTRPMGAGLELVGLRKDGSEFPLEASLSPIESPEGGGAWVCSSVRDITERQRVQRELADRLAFQRALLDSIPYPVFVKDAQTRFLSCNRAYEQTFGTTREALRGKTVLELEYLPLEERQRFQAEDSEVIAAADRRSYELPIVFADGLVHQTLYSVDGFRLANGQPGGLIGLLVDLTPLRRAEEQARRILCCADEGIFGVNAEGQFTFVNPAACRLLGFAEEELIGQPAHALIHHHRPDGQPYPVEESPLHAACTQGKASRVDNEFLWRKDGTNFPVEIGCTPIESDGKILGAVITFADITERRRAEAELKQRSEALQRMNFLADSALDLAKAGYWHVPLDGSGWYNSSERTASINGDLPNPDYRYHLDEWAKAVRAGDEAAAAATLENFQAAVAGTVPVYDVTYAYRRPVDGRVVWMHALGHVARDPSGNATDMFGVTQDITEFKKLEADLIAAKDTAEEATKAKSAFLANMSHEIRTPMNAIIGLSHLALKTSLTAKQRDYLNKIHNAGTSLLGVINDILDFSKIEAGKLDLEATSFGLDEVIATVTTLTAQKAHEKGLELLAHIAPDIPERLLGDPLRLGQILTNFVNNAVKFTERGEIRVNIELLERTGAQVQLKFSVRDTGIGMTPEQSAKLFQPFTQADMSTTRKHGGTGLGLTICRRLVELMGGRIWFESQAGVGSTFYFTVRVGVSTVSGLGRAIPERLSQLRVLVVDDNAAAREIIQEPLSAFVKQVSAVASGEEAVAAVKAQDLTAPFDVIFMDWRMPGMDGLTASRHIKSDETLRQQPAIVLVTAFGREEVREEAERLRLEGFLLKPVTKSMLVDTLVEVFAAVEQGGPASSTPPDPVGRLAGARILLTEDNEINQQIAIELLESAGATVRVANHGREAVDLLVNGPQPPPFDLVLMDLQMPEMDGYQATTQLRADARFQTLPIIAMTAHATLEERQHCLAAGMNEHISKPIDPAVLYETCARFLAVPGPAPAAEQPSAKTESGTSVPLATEAVGVTAEPDQPAPPPPVPEPETPQPTEANASGDEAPPPAATPAEAPAELPPSAPAMPEAALPPAANGAESLPKPAPKPAKAPKRKPARRDDQLGLFGEADLAPAPVAATDAPADVAPPPPPAAPTAQAEDKPKGRRMTGKSAEPEAEETPQVEAAPASETVPPAKAAEPAETVPVAKPAPRAAKPRHAALDEPEIPEAEGLDTADGLMRVAGNRKLYLKLVTQFVEQQAAAAERIRDQLVQGDSATAERSAHTLKGVAGNLGAKAIHAAAAAVERAIRTQADPAEIESLWAVLDQALSALMADLKPALKPGAEKPVKPASAPVAPPPPLEIAEFRKAARDMLPLLNDLDPGAADCLAANHDTLRAAFSAEVFAEFERQVQGYEFAEALELLKRAARKHAVTL
jgi:PAS domain S-box-containing protein